MSHHGIGLLFTPGEHGQPEILYIRDVTITCPVCRHEQYFRWYSSTPYHPMHAQRLTQLLHKANTGLEHECEQCGESLDERHTSRHLIHWGFAGGKGLIQGHWWRDGREKWVLQPFRHIDAQIVPDWEPAADISNVVLDELTEEAVDDAFGRGISGKAAVRRALLKRAQRSDPPSGGFTEIAESTILGVFTDNENDEQIAQEFDRYLRHTKQTGDWHRVELNPGGQLLSGFIGAPSSWLGDLSLSGLRVIIWTDAARVFEHADRILRSFPIKVRIRQLPGTPLLVLRMPNQKDTSTSPRIDPVGIAEEAARSASPIEDVVRLEIDRILHLLTGLVSPDDDEMTTMSESENDAIH